MMRPAEWRAALMYPVILSKALRSITAPMKLLRSSTSPIRNVARSSNSRAFTFGHSEAGMYARDAALHFCLWYSNAPRSSATANASASAEQCASTKSLPPVSPTSRG
jgi:hypothetical protein